MPNPKTKDEKPGKVRRFLDFLGIKKKKPANTSPELLRYELDLILDDITHYADALPSNHPRKADLKNSILSLENQAQKDIKKAIELAGGVLDWAADEVKNAKQQAQQQQQPKQQVPQAPPTVQANVPPAPQSQASQSQTQATDIPVPPPPPTGVTKVQPKAPQAPASQSPQSQASSPKAPAPPPITAESLKQFTPEKALGSGNFATTYKMNGPGGQAVAVKVPKAKDQPKTEEERQLAAEEVAKKEEEFKREAEFYEKVGKHPNIAECYGYQTVGDRDSKQSGLVLELIEGKTANDTMADLRGKYMSGEMSAEEYFGVMQYTLKSMLEAADHMGKQGVAHRDLKPDNVMVDGNTGNVKVVDFGVSQVVGQAPTPGASVPLGYAAPEIDGKKDTTTVEDSFGVGATGYQWSEQEKFIYNQPGVQLGEARANYTADKGPAIRVEDNSFDDDENKDDEAAFEELLETVNERLSDWEKNHAANSDPADAKQIRDLAETATAHREQENFKDGLIVLRTLDGSLETAVKGSGNAEQRFAKLLERAVLQVDQLESMLLQASGLAEPGHVKSLLESVRPLLAKARQHGDRLEYQDGAGLLHELNARVQDMHLESGKHEAETLCTDFINQLMDPDPKKRLTPEQALNHPFMKNRLLDDDAAKRVLQMQNPPPGGAADPGNEAPDEKRYQTLDRAIIEAERQIKEARSALPQEAAERQSLVAQMKGLLAPSSQAKQTADQAWEAFRGLDTQLKTRLAAAKKDQDERKAVQADISRLGRVLKALASRANADPAEYKNLFKQAEVAAKPGGSLDAAKDSLMAIQSKLNEQFSSDQKLELLRDALAQADNQLNMALEKAGKNAELARELFDDAEEIFDQARNEAAEARKLKSEGNAEAAKIKTAQADRTKGKANDKKKDAEYNQKFGENMKKSGDEAAKILQTAEQLAQSDDNVEAALAEVDRASELLRVSLAAATGAAAQQVEPVESPQDDNNNSRGTEASGEQQEEEREDVKYENQEGSSSSESQSGESATQEVHTEAEFNDRAPREEKKGEEVEYSSTE